MGSKIILPRKSVWKAIAGAAIIIGTVVLTVLDVFDYRSLGIFDVVPIVIGVVLILEYIREP